MPSANNASPQTVGDCAHSDVAAVLKERFGFDGFKPGQREVIEHLLAGRSAAAVFPTGGGKSLCYQLPAVLLPGLTLVVSPLIALMKDQIDALAARGIAAQRLDSTLTAEGYREVMDEVRSGRLRMLYVAPERFNNERFRETMSRVRVSLFAVDEAHCISEWGHNFRPDYLKLAQFARMCRAERMFALTATATQRVLEDIRREFRIDPECAVRTGFYRPNLTLLTTPVAAARRDAELTDRLRDQPPGPAIVYVTLQRTAEEVAARLARAGLPARAYHAGMEDADRTAVQDWFLASDRGVVVATIAFGMGIDKANIRYIYHYNPPKSLENFAQEIGRAGRDGAEARCEVLFVADDLNVLENFAYGDTPTAEAVASLLAELFSLGEEFDVSYYELSASHDVRLLVVRTLLCYLELLGFLEGGTPFYSTYRFQPLVSSREILSHFEGERRTFLEDVLRHAVKAKTWFSLDADRASRAIGCPRDRIVRALDYLAEQQWLELKAEGVRQRYRRLRLPEDMQALAAKLHGRTLQREKSEIARLHQVLDLVRHDGCQVAALGTHFAEKRDQPCGHCSWCLGGRKPVLVPQRVEPPITPDLWRRATAIRKEHPNVFRDARMLARFLCGVSSPALVRAKLTHHDLFGALADVPFATIHQRAAAET
ncbi:MAG: ATP-dependent DNA helicase RecQ [Patescibacteria group bacterium]|nr:ATP-dependent DNA helicase RecQ [Patescibacteria group bacterium]